MIAIDMTEECHLWADLGSSQTCVGVSNSKNCTKKLRKFPIVFN